MRMTSSSSFPYEEERQAWRERFTHPNEYQQTSLLISADEALFHRIALIAAVAGRLLFAAATLCTSAYQVDLVFVVDVHVCTQAVLVAVLPVAHRTGDFDRGEAALRVVPTDVHVQRVDILHLLLTVGAR